MDELQELRIQKLIHYWTKKTQVKMPGASLRSTIERTTRKFKVTFSLQAPKRNIVVAAADESAEKAITEAGSKFYQRTAKSVGRESIKAIVQKYIRRLKNAV